MKKTLFALAVLCSFSCFAAPGGLTSPIISGGGGSGGGANTNALTPTQNNQLTNSAQLPITQYGAVTNNYAPGGGGFTIKDNGGITVDSGLGVPGFYAGIIASTIGGGTKTMYNVSAFASDGGIIFSDGGGNLHVNSVSGNGFGLTNTPSSTLTSTNGSVTIARSVNPITGETNYDLAASGGGGGSVVTNLAGFTNLYSAYLDNINVVSNSLYFRPSINSLFIGGSGFASVSTGTGETAVGYLALTNNPDYENTAIGFASLEVMNGDTVSYNRNTAVGAEAMRLATYSAQETAVGGSALFNDVFGGGNVAVGWEAAYFMSSGGHNVLIGWECGNDISTWSGTDDVFVGAAVSQTPTAISSSILIGAGIDSPTASQTNYLSIGNVIKGHGVYGNANSVSSTPITNAVISVGKEPTNSIAGVDIDGALFANHGFQVPIIQAGSTNLTLIGATTQGILFLHPMPTTNYIPVVVLNGATVAGAFSSNLTTNGFTQNMTALTFTGKMLWSVTSFTQ